MKLLLKNESKNEAKNEAKNDIKILEQDIIKIINHFYPANIIESGKTILNIKCSLWDKNIDIELSLNSLKEINKMELILIDDAYKYYLKFCRKNKCINVVNKQYFEKYVKHTLTQCIEFDKFISASKWTSVATLSEATLSEATLSEATLSEAPLSVATLSVATLSVATLSVATLSEAPLSEAPLSETVSSN